MNWGWHLVASLGRGLWPSIRTRRSLAAWSLSTQTLSIPPIRARAEVRRAQSHDPGRRSDSGLQTKGPGGKAHVQRARRRGEAGPGPHGVWGSGVPMPVCPGLSSPITPSFPGTCPPFSGRLGKSELMSLTHVPERCLMWRLCEEGEGLAHPGLAKRRE